MKVHWAGLASVLFVAFLITLFFVQRTFPLLVFSLLLYMHILWILLAEGRQSDIQVHNTSGNAVEQLCDLLWRKEGSMSISYTFRNTWVGKFVVLSICTSYTLLMGKRSSFLLNILWCLLSGLSYCGINKEEEGEISFSLLASFVPCQCLSHTVEV